METNIPHPWGIVSFTGFNFNLHLSCLPELVSWCKVCLVDVSLTTCSRVVQENFHNCKYWKRFLLRWSDKYARYAPPHQQHQPTQLLVLSKFIGNNSPRDHTFVPSLKTTWYFFRTHGIFACYLTNVFKEFPLSWLCSWYHVPDFRLTSYFPLSKPARLLSNFRALRLPISGSTGDRINRILQ